MRKLTSLVNLDFLVDIFLVNLDFLVNLLFLTYMVLSDLVSSLSIH